MKSYRMINIALSVLSIVYGLSSVAATPQVKNVRAMQQYPWGKVYISYEVVGDVGANTTKGMVPFLLVTAKNKTNGSVYATATSLPDVEPFLSGNTGCAEGLHRIVWDLGAQGVTINSADVVFTVMYCNDIFLVIDFSAGANASSYPISYLYAVPSGGWTDAYKTTKLVLRRLLAGTFKMQTSSNVTLTKPFYMGVFEVTQKQYALVMGSNPSNFKGDTLPVDKVSYNTIRGTSNGTKWPSSSAVDSTSFMGKLRARTGLDFDLPTEAQWEYACRAGTTTTYYWGNAMNGNYAWYRDNSGGTTHPVGTKKANAWGLYDMSGNVCEWCLDWYGTLAYGTDPKGPSSGSNRVICGGSWYESAVSCTSSERYPDIYPVDVYYYYGFRICLTLSE